MFTITVLMFVLATAVRPCLYETKIAPTPTLQHLFINLARLFEAFSLAQTQLGAAETVLDNFSDLKNLVRSGVILMEILLGDAVLVRIDSYISSI
jgi:hypothetical protein